MGELRIISRSAEPFADRREAGELLAQALDELRGQNPILLGIPRGGPVIAREMARRLDGEVDVILVRKLRASSQPELAIGAINEAGEVSADRDLLVVLRVPDSYLEAEKREQQREIERRRALYRVARPKATLKDRVVVVVDDGLATGATMLAALWAARAEEPARLIAAAPVGAERSLEKLVPYSDEVVCLRVPACFMAVGEFYLRFPQVEDEEVLRILREELKGAVSHEA